MSDLEKRMNDKGKNATRQDLDMFDSVGLTICICLGLSGTVLVYAWCPNVIINHTLSHPKHKALTIVYQYVPNF